MTEKHYTVRNFNNKHDSTGGCFSSKRGAIRAAKRMAKFIKATYYVRRVQSELIFTAHPKKS